MIKFARMIQLINAGAVATKMMSDTMENADKVGMPSVDIPAMLGSKANYEIDPPEGSNKWTTGALAHYALGSVFFPLAYETVYKKVSLCPKTIKPLTWGLLLWAGGAFVFMPLIGKERFKRKSILTTYLAGHIVYGAAFGALSKEKTN
ncbi:MAG: DUF6789 family protein [Candidatus Melainabacteria bacterium]|nr:DUF6789 family protein [Candidatus Melainabacteria bacterium]